MTDKPSRLRTKATVRFIDLLRPDGYWPSPYSIEQAFHIFQWMVKTGANYSQWMRSGAYDLLCCKGTCFNHSEVDPIISPEDLRRRFHHAVLSNYASKLAQEWREAERIDVTSERILTFRHHKPFAGNDRWRCEADIKNALAQFFKDGSSKRTAESLNPYHPTARTCKSVQIAVEPEKFYFRLEFGWPDEECTSHWFRDLAVSGPDEPFLLGLARAIDAFAALTEPSALQAA